jgi:integrase/recombinase XerD
VGFTKARVRSIAAMLLHIVRLLELNTLRPVDPLEIEQASLRWLTLSGFRKSAAARGNWSPFTFRFTATNWLRFHNQLTPPVIQKEPSEMITDEFVKFLRVTKGITDQVAYAIHSRTLIFLRWVLPRHDEFSKISLTDVDDFIEMKRAENCRPRTIASYCAVFRLFLRYAGMRGWTSTKMARLIKSPRISRYDDSPKGPEWRDVRRILNLDLGTKPKDLRSKAILSLCAIYAMRSVEIVRLQLSDFDRVNETLTIRRAKSGRIQQYPLAYEVGEKILKYLQFGRPRCCCQNLFVTRRAPFRPVQSASLWTVVAEPLKRLGVISNHYGAHSLRHSCATHLLRSGSSLKDVADFLGHRGLTSVGIYAKYDVRSLREVASFKLGGVI